MPAEMTDADDGDSQDINHGDHAGQSEDADDGDSCLVGRREHVVAVENERAPHRPIAPPGRSHGLDRGDADHRHIEPYPVSVWPPSRFSRPARRDNLRDRSLRRSLHRFDGDDGLVLDGNIVRPERAMVRHQPNQNRRSPVRSARDRSTRLPSRAAARERRWSRRARRLRRA